MSYVPTAEAEVFLVSADKKMAKGDEWHLKAAVDMAEAKRVDHGITFRYLGARYGRGETWAAELIKEVKNPRPDGEPFKVDWHRGTHATVEEIEAGARKALTEPKKRKKIVESMPDDAVEALAEDTRKEADKRTITKNKKKQPKKKWYHALMTRLHGSRVDAEKTLDQAQAEGLDSIPPDTAAGLADHADRAEGAYGLLASFFRGEDVNDEIAAFLAEEEARV